MSSCDASREGRILELNKLEQVFIGLRSAPRNPVLNESSVDGRLICAHRLAWLMRPLPFRIGITEVDAALKDTAIPSEVNGEDGGGRLL